MHTIFTTQSTPPRATFIDCIVCLSVNDLSSLSSPYFFFFFFFPTISQPAVFHSYYRYISLYWLCQRCSPTDVLLSIETDRDAWVERGRSSFLDPNCPFLFFALISISTDPPLGEIARHGSPRFRGKGFEQDDVEFSRHANGARWIFMAIVCRSFAPFSFFQPRGR